MTECEFAELMERERMLMWRRVSPHSNLHSTCCPEDCLNPKHFPQGDPLDEERES